MGQLSMSQQVRRIRTSNHGPGCVILDVVGKSLMWLGTAMSRTGVVSEPVRITILAVPQELSVFCERVRGNRLAAATASLVGYTAVMIMLERRMRQTGGPGIIPFELAGSESQAEDIMARWGGDGQRAARLSLWLDFGYMAAYGAFAALHIDRARQRRGHPAALPLTIMVAIAADAVEGVSLLKVLNRKRVAVHARRAQIAALIKFAVLVGALGYITADRFNSNARSRRTDDPSRLD
jgi:hypothetical protein